MAGIDFGQRNAVLQALKSLLAKYLDNEAWLGDNPAIFCYQIWRDQDRTHVLVRMRFYQDFTVEAYSVAMEASDTQELAALAT